LHLALPAQAPQGADYLPDEVEAFTFVPAQAFPKLRRSGLDEVVAMRVSD
jgi:hypothetical protein